MSAELRLLMDLETAFVGDINGHVSEPGPPPFYPDQCSWCAQIAELKDRLVDAGCPLSDADLDDLGVVCERVDALRASLPDDGWRRTDDGWEQVPAEAS